MPRRLWRIHSNLWFGDEMRQRLDQVLVDLGITASRSRARDLILRGQVKVNGRTACKPGALVDAGGSIAVAEGGNRFVSRGGDKLQAAFSHFGLCAKDHVALDIGSSTGGFCQVLLEAGARRVYAVDVGHGQLHTLLRQDERVKNLEGVDARQLDRKIIPEPVSFIVCDVSFVSMTKVMSAPLSCAGPGCRLVVLVKPQFEVGPDAVDKRGIVGREELRNQAVSNAESWLGEQGWRVCGTIPSPVPGKQGNQEFLIAAVLDGE